MIRGLRMIIRDKVAFREEEGVLRQIGKPMDILGKIPKETKFLHIVDLNAKNGNVTNFDLYDHMMYKVNIEVEIAPKEEIVKKLIWMEARAVLDLPCMMDLEKFEESRKLLVGKTNGSELSEEVYDYYIETDDLELIKKIAKQGKRIFVYSNSLDEKKAKKAGIFALIRDY